MKPSENTNKLFRKCCELLPDKIGFRSTPKQEPYHFDTGDNVTDREKLQIVQWVEEGLTQSQLISYEQELQKIFVAVQGKNYFSQWLITCKLEQRLAALEAAGIIKV